MKVLHIITGLGSGGAEGVLYRLCTNDDANEHVVVSFMGEGKYGGLLQNEGVSVYCLNQKQGRFSVRALLELNKLVRLIKPDVVQTWMYHADLIGGLVAKFNKIHNICWNIRHSSLVSGKSKRSTIFIAKLCSYLSKIVPNNIICCANSAKETHIDIGYSSTSMTVISNGYDIKMLNEKALAAPPKALENIEQPLIGLIGRYNIQKNHSGFLSSIKELNDLGIRNFKVVLVGKSIDYSNTELVELINKYSLNQEVILLGEQANVPSILKKLSFSVLPSSFGEGFPNVVAESMAIGVPCIVTDVGDAARIVDTTGWVVPPNNNASLTGAIMIALDELQKDPATWSNRKVNAKDRVTDNFSLDLMVKKYNKVWKML